MTEDESMFDPEKPYARFYRDNDHIAQIHTRTIPGLGFGRVGWNITASHCDESGAAVQDEDGNFKILQAPNGEPMMEQVIIQGETLSDIAFLIDEARTRMAQRVALAVQQAAAAEAIQ